MTREEQITRLWQAHETLTALEYELCGFDANQLQTDIRNHPRRGELEEVITARGNVWVVLMRLERQRDAK